jgi:hypothetical protein
MVEDQDMIEGDTIDITSAAFARRLANLLVKRRSDTGASLRSLSKVSKGGFSVRELRELEEGRRPLDEGTIGAVAMLYQADLDSILPTRLPLEIRPFGVLSTSGLTAPFVPDDSTSLLSSYLRLIRQLRLQQREPMIELRREDIEVIAEFLGESATAVIERLGALMGATQSQRRAMAGMFLAGAVVIGLAGGSVAAFSGGGSSPSSPDTTPAPQAVTTTLVIEQSDSSVSPSPTSSPTSSVAPDDTLGTAPAATVVTVTTPAPAPPPAAAPVEVAPAAPVTVAAPGRSTAAPADTTPTTTPATEATPPAAGSVIFGGPEIPTQADPITPLTIDPGTVANDTPPLAPDTTLAAPDTTVTDPPIQATDLPPVPSLP